MKHIITAKISIDFKQIQNYNFYFIGILGSGMSAIARFLRLKGAAISGSDRSYSNFMKSEQVKDLETIGCKLFNQNGQHLDENINFAVVSTAVESDNPDVIKAVAYNLPIIHRADLLAYIVNQNKAITVAGTSGKSTTVGIIGYLLKKANIDINIMTGAAIKEINAAGESLNCITGNSDLYLIETDESDGSIVKFQPEYALLTNITKDHKTIEELKILFQEYLNNARNKIFINTDDTLTMQLNYSGKQIVKIGTAADADYKISDIIETKEYTSFNVNDKEYMITLPGAYNVYNSAFAIAIAEMFDIEYPIIKSILAEFKGVADRYEYYRKNAPAVIYDYAHNPAKIDALLGHLVKFHNRILFIYQPHGYQPTFFLKNELYKVFSNYFMADSHKILLKEIYYAGGTVDKKITSEEITADLKKNNVNIEFAAQDIFITEYIQKNNALYDAIVIAGARDPKLRELCGNIAALFN